MKALLFRLTMYTLLDSESDASVHMFCRLPEPLR